MLVQLEPHIVRKWDNVVSLKSRASCIRRVFTLQLSMRNFAEAYAPPLANYTTLPARLRGQPDDRMVFAPVHNGYNHLTSCNALEIRGNWFKDGGHLGSHINSQDYFFFFLFLSFFSFSFLFFFLSFSLVGFCLLENGECIISGCVVSKLRIFSKISNRNKIKFHSFYYSFSLDLFEFIRKPISSFYKSFKIKCQSHPFH